MTGLIDSTEMYLRTLYELREEGIPPLRARLVERLHVSAPAASESTSRLASEGLVALANDRTVQFTEKGLVRATAVMRKHRLAELLLTEVIGLDWALVHNEACRWEHVISDEVEARLTEILGDPKKCPFGNVIPAGSFDRPVGPRPPAPLSLLAATDFTSSRTTSVTVSWISERLQTDERTMRQLRDGEVLPGARLVIRGGGDIVEVLSSDAVALAEEASTSGQNPGQEAPTTEISRRAAGLVYVEHSDAAPHT
ncbi:MULTISPECIES: metal-dependent transcriptional regulator [Protofrankia]|uniref:Iron (Metal) dependent repressor, DtxR family n=1 Tax=Candidatus Protofrankia datiscae TaxID=2716812 RepID=F8B1S0_9ACTN|nr:MULTISPECIES: metal-dependent transcriptional regulator [Protofrankia]AEH07676.1 iron (metal) dependent repressor, DtxR family [Candidatus Protofrankia datiscae]